LKIKNIILATSLCLFCFAELKAQVRKGNKYFLKKDFEKAAAFYENDSITTLADPIASINWAWSYVRLKQDREAIKCFLAIEKTGILYKTDAIQLTQSYINCGDLESAKSIISKKTQNLNKDSDWKKLQVTFDSLQMWNSQVTNKYVKKVESINGCKDDYSLIVKDSLVFFVSTSIGNSNLDKDIFEDRTSSSSIYQSNHTLKGYSKPKRILKKTSTKYNDGPFIFSSDGKTIFFTRSRKEKVGSNHPSKLKIFKATFTGKDWGNIEEFPFNSSAYNMAHPALSSDEKTIFFSSDKSGSLGGMDLWMSKWNGNQWEEPIHLGNNINTNKNELFPTINNDTLYFSTEGLIGYGNLDIFKVPLNKINDNPINLKAPVNSPFDDFGIYFTSVKNGFFTSNRLGGEGMDDIYSFDSNELSKKMDMLRAKEIDTVSQKESLLKIDLYGQIYEQKRGDITDAMLIYLLDDKGKIIGQTYTNAAGELLQRLIRLADGDFVYVRLTPDDDMITLLNEDDVVIQIKPQENFLIPNIYYELNSSVINQTAEIQLNKLAVIIKKNPHIKVQLSSHTDSRATADYNLDLSNKRAQAAINYLVLKGVDRSVIIGKGFGEVELLNQCKDNIYCSEEEHAVNRRTEFRISRK
jgi:outer membrane protein OmpA-like peptidoglycan-associated protein